MEPTPRTAAGYQITLILACGVFLSCGVILAGIGPSLPRLALQIGRDIAVLGWLFTAVSIGAVVSQFWIVRAIRSLGQRAVLTLGMVLIAIGTIGVTASTQLPLLLVGALLIGIGFGNVLAAGNGLIAQLFPTRSAAALNGINIFFGVGSMSGPAIAGLAAARLGMPQVALWIGAGLLLVLAPLVLWFAAPPPALGMTAEQSRVGAPPMPGIWLLGFLLLMYTGTEIGFGGWITVYLINSSKIAATSAALATAGFWLALTIGRGLGVLFGLRFTPQTLLLSSLLGMLGAALLLANSVDSLGRSIVGVALFGLSCGPVFPTTLAIVTSAARQSGTGASLVLALGNSGGLILPALLGQILSRYGPSAMAGMLLAETLLMMLLGLTAAWAGTNARIRSNPAPNPQQ